MTEEKIAGALGLVRRAGKVTVGTFLVKEAVEKKKAALVLFAADAGLDGEKKIRAAAERQKVPVHRIGLTKAALAHAVGKKGEAVCVSVPGEFVNLVLASM
jgi:ribosomal protein L7Ae-like RNA K-turn-binding protein